MLSGLGSKIIIAIAASCRVCPESILCSDVIKTADDTLIRESAATSVGALDVL